MAAKKQKASPKAKSAASKTAASKKPATKAATTAAKKSAAKTPKAKAESKSAASKASTSKKASAKKTAAKKAPTKQAAGKKKAAAKKAASAKTQAAKVTAAEEKTDTGKAATRKTAAKKAVQQTSEQSPPVKKRSANVKVVPTLPRVSTTSKASADSPFKNYTPYEPAAGEEYMNTEQEAHFRNILNQWRQELMEEVDRTVNHMQDEATNFPDPADRATQEEEFSIELRTRDRERKLIKKIDQTLERLEQQDYGYCDTCGIEIGLRRLEARPTATLCVDCKTLDELRERQLHG